MPTTVIQVFGSLTCKTIDSVLKVDHVSEESPLSSLTLIKQISLLTNTINPPQPAFLSQRLKRKPLTWNIELGKEASILVSDVIKTSSLPDCSKVLISLNLKRPILFALMCPSLRFDRWLLAFWSKSAHISFSASVPPSTWTWSVSPSVSESSKKLPLI